MKQLSLIFMVCFTSCLYAQNNSTSINMNINMNLDAISGDMPESQQNSNMNINFNIEENTTRTFLTHLTTKRLLLLLNSLRSFMYRDIAVKLAVHLLLTLKELRIWQKPLKIRPLVTIKFV